MIVRHQGFTILTHQKGPHTWTSFAVRKSDGAKMRGPKKSTKAQAISAMKRDIDYARENPGVGEAVGGFITRHPWMTFFGALAIVSAIVTIIRGYQPPLVIGGGTPPNA
jgi:hypothetical protein